MRPLARSSVNFRNFESSKLPRAGGECFEYVKNRKFPFDAATRLDTHHVDAAAAQRCRGAPSCASLSQEIGGRPRARPLTSSTLPTPLGPGPWARPLASPSLTSPVSNHNAYDGQHRSKHSFLASRALPNQPHTRGPAGPLVHTHLVTLSPARFLGEACAACCWPGCLSHNRSSGEPDTRRTMLVCT